MPMIGQCTPFPAPPPPHLKSRSYVLELFIFQNKDYNIEFNNNKKIIIIIIIIIKFSNLDFTI